MLINQTKALKPRTTSWIARGLGPGGFIYDHVSGLRVCSSVDETQYGEERHISISINGKPPSTEWTEKALNEFGAEDFEEDNENLPTRRARHFWEHKKECKCDQ